MDLQIESTCARVSCLVLGMIENNVYIIDDDGACFVVDPSCHAERILEALDGRMPEAIAITHGHWDHTGAAQALREATGAPVIASRVEAPFIDGRRTFDAHSARVEPCPVDRLVDDGDIIEIGTMKWQVIATPGHTPGGMCLFMEPDVAHVGAPILASGDTLVAGTHGRVDFPESSIEDMRTSLVRLSALPGETVVLPGHAGITTIARESGWLRLCAL